MKKRILLLLVMAALLLSGCMLTVDEMYRIPKRSERYNDLQSAMDKAMTGLTYCAPKTGENQQTVQMADLDGDGQAEYLLFAKSTAERPLRILVFRDVDGTFVNTDTVECNGAAFDQIEYVDMDGYGGVEIVVGRQLSDQVIRSASVYTYTEGELVQLASANYTKLLTTDFDGDNLMELFILRPGQTDTDPGVAELYSMKSGILERYNEATMSQPTQQLKRILVGKLSDGKTAVYTASSVDTNALMTDVFAVVDGVLRNITLSNDAQTSVQTMRNYYVYADDIDNDSVVELPQLITMKPRNGMAPADNHQLIRWYALTQTGEAVDKMYTYHNFVGGWYLQLQSQWVPHLVVANMGYMYEFYMWDENYKTNEKVLTIYALTGQNREEQGISEGRFVLHRSDTTVYSALLERCSSDYGLTQENVIYSFRLIQQDWKTGET